MSLKETGMNSPGALFHATLVAWFSIFIKLQLFLGWQFYPRSLWHARTKQVFRAHRFHVFVYGGHNVHWAATMGWRCAERQVVTAMMAMTAMTYRFRRQGYPTRAYGLLDVPPSDLIPTTTIPTPQGTAIKLETGATVQLQCNRLG